MARYKKCPKCGCIEWKIGVVDKIVHNEYQAYCCGCKFAEYL